MQPLVTIVTPAYNQERFIGACIESVLGQSYDRWEQVVVDDGSSDRTAEIAASYRDSRIRVIRLPHRGLSSLAETYNTALGASRGEVVAVLEGDDAWPADKLGQQIGAFDDPAVFLSWGRGAAIDDAGRRQRPLSTIRTTQPHIDHDAAEIFARLVRTNLLAPAASVMIRRSALDAVGGFQQGGSSFYVDLATWLTLTARVGGRVRFVNRELAWYRIHADQTTRRFGRNMDLEHGRIVADVVSRLDGETLLRVRWAALRQSAAVATMLAEARTGLASADYAGARRGFVQALRLADTWPDRAKAAIGLVSGLVHVDVLSRTLALRERVIAR